MARDLGPSGLVQARLLLARALLERGGDGERARALAREARASETGRGAVYDAYELEAWAAVSLGEDPRPVWDAGLAWLRARRAAEVDPEEARNDGYRLADLMFAALACPGAVTDERTRAQARRTCALVDQLLGLARDGLASDFTRAGALALRARAERCLGDLDRAAADVEEARGLPGSDQVVTVAQEAVAVPLARGELDLARARLRKALARFPADAPLRQLERDVAPR
jgi:hypothetical protein